MVSYVCLDAAFWLLLGLGMWGYSVFTLAAGHGMVQYGTTRYAYFFKCKQVSY